MFVQSYWWPQAWHKATSSGHFRFQQKKGLSNISDFFNGIGHYPTFVSPISLAWWNGRFGKYGTKF